MIEFKAENKPRISLTLDGQAEITFTTQKSVVRDFEALQDKPLTVTAKEYRPKRTLSQNSYLWVLLDQVAQVVARGKEEVYKDFVRDYGVFEILPIRNEAVDSFAGKWSKNGIGWFCEDLGESKLNGYTKLIAYFGSSTYNTKEMARLIDAVLQTCHDLGIQAMPLSDVMLLANDNDT